ncbi:acyltransferase [Natrononativus amylolyticus]|uniref:acyltransferase n=1 Tax=Natrononativus amylolyticus TaxID=2963434 RepID=UPI0020CCDF06|nr:acyltransferase [Natrononativus amylolyticus]
MTYSTGENAAIDDGATVGYGYDHFGEPARLGDDATVRAGTIVYADVTIGDGFTTGHNALVREATRMGDDVLVGTGSVIDGTTEIGSNVSIQSGVYVPTDTTVGSNVFFGPHAVLTNDPYPVRQDVDLEGPTIEDGVSVGANATILPGVTVGESAFVAAGAVVTEDVPPETLVVGAPGEHLPLPETLQAQNQI